MQGEVRFTLGKPARVHVVRRGLRPLPFQLLNAIAKLLNQVHHLGVGWVEASSPNQRLLLHQRNFPLHHLLLGPHHFQFLDSLDLRCDHLFQLVSEVNVRELQVLILLPYALSLDGS